MLVTILLLVFLIPSPAMAITDVVTSDSSVEVRIENRVNTSDSVRQNIRLKVDAKRDEIRTKLTAKRRERIRNFFAKAVTRIEALIARLNNLITRLETRIEKINEVNTDLDTTSAEKSIAEAKTLISSASSKLEEAKSLSEDALSSDTPKDAFKEVIGLVRGIKSDLHEIHKLLRSIIGDIKGLRVGDTK